MTEPIVDRVIDRQRWLDPTAELIQKAVGGAYRVLGRPGEAVRSAMHGTRVLGHPLHPALTDLPVGAWTVGVVADFVAHFTNRIPTEAGDIALAIGLVGALGSAVTGYTDFYDTYGHERRVTVSHGLAMTAAVLLDAASLGLRWWAGIGLHPLAVGLSTAGWAVLVGGAYLGGHAVFNTGTMVNHLAFIEPPEEPVEVGTSADFPEGAMRKVDAGSMAALVVRRGGVLCAIADVCTHAGGPLHEGTLDGNVVTCPWHGSRFRIDTGQPLRGPATFPQPTFAVHEQEGRVWLRAGPPSREVLDVVGHQHRRDAVDAQASASAPG